MRVTPGHCLLRSILRRKKLSQRWLSEKTGYPEPQISDYVNNKTKMGYSTAATIALALDMHAEELYDWILNDKHGE